MGLNRFRVHLNHLFCREMEDRRDQRRRKERKTGGGGEEKGKEKLFSSFWCQALKHRR